MVDIFLSYARSDSDKAEALAAVLTRRGWSVFWDRNIPAGSMWRETIGRELAEARCVLVLWSKASIESHWVIDEADWGREHGILVPIRIEEITPPLGFRAIQCSDFIDWQRALASPTLNGLLAILDGKIRSPESAKAPTRKFPGLSFGKLWPGGSVLQGTKVWLYWLFFANVLLVLQFVASTDGALDFLSSSEKSIARVTLLFLWAAAETLVPIAMAFWTRANPIAVFLVILVNPLISELSVATLGGKNESILRSSTILVVLLIGLAASFIAFIFQRRRLARLDKRP